MDDKFCVTIEAKIERADGTPYADERLHYHDMGYEDVVALEKVWLTFHEMLTGIGEEKAKEKKAK